MHIDNVTQFAQTSNNSQICDIVIGIDFGTSCTKIVLQSPHHFNSRTMLVAFEEFAHPNNPYLLPTRIFFDAEGVCLLQAFNGSFANSNLKLKLLQNSDDIELNGRFVVTPRTLAISYLALVLRYARTWFLIKQYDIYKQFKICWHVNMGVPSAGYDDEDIKTLFRNVIIDAWRISTDKAGISLKYIQEKLNPASEQQKLHDMEYDSVNVIPEIAAEVVGYTKSNLRDTGLHFLIDIGASTVDISGFILHDKEGEDKYAFLTCALDASLGAFFCHQARIGAIREYLSRWFTHLSMQKDMVQPISPSIERYFPTLADFGKTGEKEINEGFYKKCRALINSTLMVVKRERDPLSEKWKSGLPVFLCGGGKSLDIYKYVLDDLNEYWKANMGTSGFVFRELPLPDNFDAEYLNENEFNRFAVAYGLSFPHYNIGEIKPPREISNIILDRTSKYADKEYFSKEMM